jgi:hypothetical protein
VLRLFFVWLFVRTTFLPLKCIVWSSVTVTVARLRTVDGYFAWSCCDITPFVHRICPSVFLVVTWPSLQFDVLCS